MTKLIKIELYMLIVSVSVYISCLIARCFKKWYFILFIMIYFKYFDNFTSKIGVL